MMETLNEFQMNQIKSICGEKVDVRPVPMCPGWFATDCGRIFSAFKKHTHEVVGKRTNAYLQVDYKRNGYRKMFQKHRLIALTFFGDSPEGKPYVLHGDGNGLNNAVGNLRWGNQAENLQDAVKHGTIAKGEDNARAKLSDLDVIAIRTLQVNGWTHEKIASALKVSAGHIYFILKRKKWKHIPAPNTTDIEAAYRWTFAERLQQS